MADEWLGSIELKFLARGGFDIGSHQVQTKGRVKGFFSFIYVSLDLGTPTYQN